jgi:hypothetical protein
LQLESEVVVYDPPGNLMPPASSFIVDVRPNPYRGNIWP